MKKPISLLIISVVAIVFSILSTPEFLSFNLKKIEEDQKLDLGQIEKGHYHFYTKWVFNGETVGSTPADIEITTTSGALLSTHMESNKDDTTSDFLLTDKDHLKATVRILSIESVDGAEARLVLAPEKSTLHFFLFVFSGLGIIVALTWIIRNFLVRKK